MSNFCLITGASSGIGRELAYVAAKDGRNLILTARSKSKLLELKSELTKKYGVKIEIINLDLSLAESPQEVFNFL
jgi:short-subunit dehydrogenase